MNRALGCLARFHINQGDTISLSWNGKVMNNIEEADPEMIYYGAIFPETAKAFAYQTSLSDAKVVVGGHPFNDVNLPSKIDELRPYYDLWGVKYSLGYTSRGCPRKCGFCIVPDKEGGIRDYQPVRQFHDPSHKRVILLDNNFLASPKWSENLAYITEQHLGVNFTQGLDLRLVNEETAVKLKETRFYDMKFGHRVLSFAFDSSTYTDAVRKGLQTLLDAGFKPHQLQVYVLVGYDETFEQELARCELLWNEYSVMPFIMLFQSRDGAVNARDDPRRQTLARFYNKHIMKSPRSGGNYKNYTRRPKERGEIAQDIMEIGHEHNFSI
jgi:hypothetical protein